MLSHLWVRRNGFLISQLRASDNFVVLSGQEIDEWIIIELGSFYLPDLYRVLLLYFNFIYSRRRLYGAIYGGLWVDNGTGSHIITITDTHVQPIYVPGCVLGNLELVYVFSRHCVNIWGNMLRLLWRYDGAPKLPLRLLLLSQTRQLKFNRLSICFSVTCLSAWFWASYRKGVHHMTNDMDPWYR